MTIIALGVSNAYYACLCFIQRLAMFSKDSWVMFTLVGSANSHFRMKNCIGLGRISAIGLYGLLLFQSEKEGSTPFFPCIILLKYIDFFQHLKKNKNLTPSILLIGTLFCRLTICVSFKSNAHTYTPLTSILHESAT